MKHANQDVHPSSLRTGMGKKSVLTDVHMSIKAEDWVTSDS